MTGRLDEAWAVFEDALSRSRDLGAEWKTASINMYRGAALLIAGDPIAAESALRPSVESLQRMGERSNMSTGVAILGEALYRQGKYDEAMLATLVSQEATAEDDLASQMAWRGVRAKVLAVRGELREAERLAREGVAIADGTGFVSMAGDAHMDLAAVLEAAGRTREAAAEIEIAHGLYERKGNVVSAGAAAARLEELRETLDERTGGAA
jgi:tetratricopeptide (TPR) repeat protein